LTNFYHILPWILTKNSQLPGLGGGFFMKRIIDRYLAEWAVEPDRKPCLLRGARQIGKTYSVRQLGATFKHFIEINFERNPRAIEIFEETKDLDPKRILQEIAIITHQEHIIPGSTLLFFDEIQAAPRAIIALRYFWEEMREMHVIAAGSLLDFAIEKVGMPVGRVSSLYMYPVSFIEFLSAIGAGSLVDQLFTKQDFMYSSSVAHNHLLDLLGKYLATGGMPDAINEWIKSGNINKCLIRQQEIIDAYRQDFGKYARKSQINHVEKVFESIPRQLGGKFKFSTIDSDYRKRELAPALDLLTTASVAHKIFHTAAQGIPLGADVDNDIFKVNLMDVAITQKILGLDTGSWILNPLPEFVNKGPLVEAFVGQELLAYADPRQKKQLYYWQRSEKNSTAEVDYVMQQEENIIPIEVKSGHRSTLKSMHMFLETHQKTPHGIRFSIQQYSKHEKIYSYPLYAIASVMLQDKEMALRALT